MKTPVLNLLYIEDDIIDQTYFSRLLEHVPSCVCKIVASVAVAKKVLATQTFDIIITDNMLGDGTAADILPFINGTPTILVTGTNDKQVLVNAYDLGVNAHIIKPIMLLTLVEQLENISQQKITIEAAKTINKKAPSYSFINLSFITESTNNDTDFVIEMINMYLEQCDDFLNEIQTSFLEKNWANLHKIAHRFKSSLNVIGAEQMRQLSEKIEINAKLQENPQLINKAIQQLSMFNNMAVQELHKAIKDMRQQ